MIRLTIRGGHTYTGHTVEEIIRREYGPAAQFWPSRDRNSPEAGTIVSPATDDHRTFAVQAVALSIEDVP